MATIVDRLEEDYVPDRELRIRALLDVVDAIAGTAPTVLDLACGTGTITCLAQADERADWDAWREEAARDPALRFAAAQRREVFGSNYPTEEFSPPADWHIAALSEAGFAEAGVVWRSGTGAVVAAAR